MQYHIDVNDYPNQEFTVAVVDDTLKCKLRWSEHNKYWVIDVVTNDGEVNGVACMLFSDILRNLETRSKLYLSGKEEPTQDNLNDSVFIIYETEDV